MTREFLNLATKKFEENESNGLMVCGINWGGADDSDYQWTNDVVGESFFSDERFNDFPYRNRLVKWFDIFGHPLATTAERAGPFERSIVQTNWLRSQTPNMRGRSLQAECVDAWSNFEFHIHQLKPKLLMFMSVALLDILNSPECAAHAHRLFGAGTPPVWERRDVLINGKPRRRLRIGFQTFDRIQIVAFPHPTGTPGLSDDYIAAFSDVVSPLLARYKKERGFIA